MEKIGWIIVLIAISLLSVISVINITGFVVQRQNQGLCPIGEVCGSVVQFPGDPDDTPSTQGDENNETTGTEDDIPEFHFECASYSCVVIEGPGEDLCNPDGEECAASQVVSAECGNNACESGEDAVTCLQDCPVGVEPQPVQEETPDLVENEEGQIVSSSGRELNDEEINNFIEGTYRTCTANFKQCVRIPKTTGNERDLCGSSSGISDCIAISESRNKQKTQLSPVSEEISPVLKIFMRLLGFNTGD